MTIGLAMHSALVTSHILCGITKVLWAQGQQVEMNILSLFSFDTFTLPCYLESGC